MDHRNWPRRLCVHLDARAVAQFEYIKRHYAIIGVQMPSTTAIVRRALSLLTDHLDHMTIVGRTHGERKPTPAAIRAEMGALGEHHKAVPLMPLHAIVDGRGRLKTFAEAIQANNDRTAA